MRAALTSWVTGTVSFTFLAASFATDLSWNVVTTPNRGPFANGLNAVAAVSDNAAFAVGHFYQEDLAAYRTMVQHWDGSSWRIVASPSLGRGYNDLYAVSATSPGDAWAVGYWRATNDADYRPLVLHWDGGSWRTQTLSLTQNGQLLGVAALAADDAWAVGSVTEDGAARPLALHWNGSGWTRVNVPAPAGARYAVLNAVAALGARELWAVGAAYVDGRYLTLTARGDGASFRLVPSPNAGLRANRLRGVAAAARDEVWAVGDALGVGGLILRWDGSSWRIDAQVRPSTGTVTLYGVVSPRAGEAWSIGYLRDSEGIRATAQHWDGGSWTALTVPSPSPFTAPMAAVLRDRTLWAVGIRSGGDADRTLGLRAQMPY